MRVFLSYSSSNYLAVLPLVQDLSAFGQEVPFARKTVGAPVRWRRIAADIQASDLFVSTLTSQSLISYTCWLELDYATRLGKCVLPIQLADVDFERLPPQLEGVAVVDYRRQDDEARMALAQAIQTLPAANESTVHQSASFDWMAPLEEMRERIDNIDTSYEAQATILFNLREFAERQETLEPAAGLMELLATRELSLFPRTAKQIERTLGDINTLRARSKRRRTALAGVAVSFALAVPLFFLSTRSALVADADETPSPALIVQNIETTEELVSPTISETLTPTSTRTATGSPSSTIRRTSTRQTPTRTPTQRSATVIPTQVQTTSVPPTSIPPTAVPPTSAPPTNPPPTAVPPTSPPPTQIPPTAVPPTSAPPTNPPPTAVPPTSPPPTQIPPTNVPPTNPPPTDPPPTDVPPLLPPIDLPLPTIDLPLLPPINLGENDNSEGRGNGEGGEDNRGRGNDDDGRGEERDDNSGRGNSDDD